MATLKEAKNKKQSESNEQMSFCESIDVLNDLCVDGSIRFADIKPSWEIVEFDEDTEGIPRDSKSYHKNPLDEKIALAFQVGRSKYVYYLHKTNKLLVSDRLIFDTDRIADDLGPATITDHRVIRDEKDKTQSFVYEMVMGDYLVYRCFEITAECRETSEDQYVCSVSPVKEMCRYVFYGGVAFVESRDHISTVTTVDKIDFSGLYDTLKDADKKTERFLYREFFHKVNILYKSEVIQILEHVKKQQPKLGIRAFTEIYKRVTEKKSISANTPERIIRELNGRSHFPNTAVRIEKDLVVVTGEHEFEYLDCKEETRAYFDRESAYFFRRNIVTGHWSEESLYEYMIQNNRVRYRDVEKDIFDNTCLEKYAAFAVNKLIPTGSKVLLGSLLAQFKFLSAEQAAKVDRDILEVILNNIYNGKIRDEKKTLPEIFGITGAQIKFLKNIEIPADLNAFSECMQDVDFKKCFPDVKKRIFAVAFYLSESGLRVLSSVTKKEVCDVAQTINSLEKSRTKDRKRILSEYADYIRMHRSYQEYITNMRDDDPMRQEILSYGELSINIKPSQIRDYHHKLSRVLEVIRCSDDIIRYTETIEERRNNEAENTEYTDGTYSILMPKNAEDIINEGRELQHCVGRAGYIQSMAEGACMILFLRDCKALDTPLITIEVHDNSIKQCYGFRDSYNHDLKIRDFITDYALRQNLKIDAVIYSEK